MPLKRVASLIVCGVFAVLAPGCGTTKPSEEEPACAVQQLSPEQTQVLSTMLAEVPSYITQAIAYNESLLPRNPQHAAFIQAKVAMLQSPTLANDISEQHFYRAASATSIDGRPIPVIAVFPDNKMCSDAAQAVQELAQALPILEPFMAMPYPAVSIRVWYGFTLGSSGGAGTLEMEDKGTYQARGGGAAIYEAILDHELSHAYIAHESLNQFLELYCYNMVRTNSPDVKSWTYTRGYVAFQPDNERIHALLDVYQWLGKDAMAGAYRAVYPLHPGYGVELCAACKQVFVDWAPAARKADVAAKMDMVGP